MDDEQRDDGSERQPQPSPAAEPTGSRARYAANARPARQQLALSAGQRFRGNHGHHQTPHR